VREPAWQARCQETEGHTGSRHTVEKTVDAKGSGESDATRFQESGHDIADPEKNKCAP